MLETVPMFDVEPAEPQPLTERIRAILPGATRREVAALEELLAAEIRVHAESPRSQRERR